MRVRTRFRQEEVYLRRTERTGLSVSSNLIELRKNADCICVYMSDH